MRTRPSVFSLQMLDEAIIYVVWNAVDLYILNMNLNNRRLLSISNADPCFVCVDCSRMWLCATPCKAAQNGFMNVNTASYVLRD